MRVRLGLGVAALLIGGCWMAACGSTDESIAGDADGGGDALANTDGSGDGALPTGTCDNATAATCAPRKCDLALGCVECSGDGDCAGTNPFCIRGSCEACRTNTDCGVAAPSCWPGDHRCHLSCAVDGGAKCSANGNGNGNGNGPDPGAVICDTATGACIGCRTATDCPATAPLCEPTTQSCVQCTQNSECPATRPRCDLRQFQCVQCVTAGDCAAGQACTDTRCVAKCTSNAQCPDNQRSKCNTTTGVCVECVTSPDCSASPNRPICAATDRCVQCVANTDCGDAGAPYCDQRQCVECRSDADCPDAGPNRNCDNGRCRP